MKLAGTICNLRYFKRIMYLEMKFHRINIELPEIYNLILQLLISVLIRRCTVPYQRMTSNPYSIFSGQLSLVPQRSETCPAYKISYTDSYRRKYSGGPCNRFSSTLSIHNAHRIIQIYCKSLSTTVNFSGKFEWNDPMKAKRCTCSWFIAYKMEASFVRKNESGESSLWKMNLSRTHL